MLLGKLLVVINASDLRILRAGHELPVMFESSGNDRVHVRPVLGHTVVWVPVGTQGKQPSLDVGDQLDLGRAGMDIMDSWGK